MIDTEHEYSRPEAFINKQAGAELSQAQFKPLAAKLPLGTLSQDSTYLSQLCPMVGGKEYKNELSHQTDKMPVDT